MIPIIPLHNEIIVMDSLLALEWPASQFTRAKTTEAGGMLRLGEGRRGGRLSLDALTDDGKSALRRLVEEMSTGAIVRVPLAQIDPARSNMSAIVRPSSQIAEIVSASLHEYGAMWEVASPPEAPWINRLGSINGRTFRVNSIAGSSILVSPGVVPAAGDRPDAPVDASIKFTMREPARVPLLRRAMSAEPALSATLDVIEVIT